MQNKNVLDEVNKGCSMGMDAITDVLDKVSDNVFKKVLKGEYNKYNNIHDRIEKVYNDYSSLEPTETNSVNKAMTSMMINMKTLTDTSNSKIAELLLQGTNMGIIEGRKLLNHKDELDSEVYKILTDFIEMQEDSVETLKKYL